MKTNDNGVNRNMNKEEVEIFEIVEAEAKTQAQAEANRQALKQATLAKLGLTADEVAALLS